MHASHASTPGTRHCHSITTTVVTSVCTTVKIVQKGKARGWGSFDFYLVSLLFLVVVVLKSDTVQVTKGVFRCNLNLTSAMSPFKPSNMLPLCMNEPSCNHCDFIYSFC